MSPTMSLRELTSLTDQTIVKGLENVPGVARIDVNGRVTRQILIQIRPQALTALGIGVDQVMNAIRTANQDMPAGRLSRGQSDVIVRVEGKIKDPAQFGRIIVAQQGGAPVYLSQVADVIDGEKEETSIARINGRPSITLDLQKAQDANIVETGAGVMTAIAELRKRLPKDVELTIINNTAEQVEKSVNRVKQTIVEGALLTVLIVFLFLHSWRSTVITGLTLPIAVIATFIALNAFGFTLNFLTLMALSLCIGLLIDDAIVVRENIVRHLGMGKDHATAAREGTDEIGLAVMATTFAIVAVFVPIAFMSGIIGRFFFQFGVTVAVAVLVGLFVSFTLDPMLSSIWHDPPGSRFRRVPWLGRFMDRGRARHRVRCTASTARLLDWALGHRKTVLAIALVTLLRQLRAGPADRHRVHSRGRPGLHLAAPQHAGGLEPRVHRRQGAAGRGGAEGVPRGEAGDDDRRDRGGPQLRALNLKLVDRGERSRSQQEVEKAIRERAAADRRHRAHVRLQPADLRQRARAGSRHAGADHRDSSKERVARVPGIADLEIVRQGRQPGARVRLNNDAAAELGITVQQVGRRCGRCSPATP